MRRLNKVDYLCDGREWAGSDASWQQHPSIPFCLMETSKGSPIVPIVMALAALIPVSGLPEVVISLEIMLCDVSLFDAVH